MDNVIAPLILLGLMIGFLVFAANAGRVIAENDFVRDACAASCQRHHKSKPHHVDSTFCTCANGATLKRDRSALYVPVARVP